MNVRLLVFLAILASGPVSFPLAFSLTEVVVTGYLKNDQAEPFSIE